MVWARDARAARALCLQDTGRQPGVVLTGDPQTAGGMTPLAVQKKLFGPFHLMTLVYGAWYLVMQPLTAYSLTFAVDPLTILNGQIPGGLVFAGFQALYALAVLAMLLLTGRNERYTNRSHLALLNGLIASGLCGFFLAFAVVDGATGPGRSGLDALAVGIFLLLAFLLIHAIVTGRLPGFKPSGFSAAGTDAAPCSALIRRLRSNPYSVELISLAGIPALWLNAEASRGLLQFPLRWIRQDLMVGQAGLGFELGLVFLLIYGTMVYALLIYPSRTIGIHDLEHRRNHRVVQEKPPVLKPFFLSYLGYLTVLSINLLYGYFLGR